MLNYVNYFHVSVGKVMKLQNLLLPLGVVAIAALAFSAYNAAFAPLPDGFPSPTPNGKIEVKQYPVYRAATVRPAGELAQAASRAFSPLFQHISANEISMTAPVEARYPLSTLETSQDSALNDGEAYVSFLYRNTDVFPEQVAQGIQVEDIAPMTVVSLGRRGSYSFQSYEEGLADLKAWLGKHPRYRVVGSPRRFFYDGPYVPDPFKRSEIQIPIQLVDE